MKKIVLLLLCLLLLPFYVVKGETTDQINNQLEAGVNYSPTFYSESYVSNFLHPMSAPILPENIGPRMLLEQGWKIWHPPKGMKLIPQETLKPWPFDYDIFENDYAVFSWYRERRNDKKVKWLDKVPKFASAIGQGQFESKKVRPYLQVANNALYETRKDNHSTNLLILRRFIIVPRADHKGLAGGNTIAKLSSGFDETMSIGVSGVMSSGLAWQYFGLNLIVYAYEDPPVIIYSLKHSSIGTKEIKKMAEEIERKYSPGKKIYFISYKRDNESKKEGLVRAAKLAIKVSEHSKPELVSQFMLLAPPYSPPGVKVKNQPPIFDLLIANPGIKIDYNPHIIIKGEDSSNEKESEGDKNGVEILKSGGEDNEKN